MRNFISIKTPEQSDQWLPGSWAGARLRSTRSGLPHRARHHCASGSRALAHPPPMALIARMARLTADLCEDWHRVDERIEAITEVKSLAGDHAMPMPEDSTQHVRMVLRRMHPLLALSRSTRHACPDGLRGRLILDCRVCLKPAS